MSSFLRTNALGGLGLAESLGTDEEAFNWNALLQTTQQVVKDVGPSLVTALGPQLQQYVPQQLQQYIPMMMPTPQPTVVQMQNAPSSIEKYAPYAIGAAVLGVLAVALGGGRRR